MFRPIAMNSPTQGLSLTLRLQEKLDEAVQNPQSFGKSVEDPFSLSVPESGDENGSLTSAASPSPDVDSKADDDNTTASNIIVKCSYRDFSGVLPEKNDGPSSLISQSTTAKEPTFPVKLHMILSNPEFQDIISWLPHGRSWRILQQKAFEERVIPLYFRHGRYSSFARQVNGWGFRRVTHGSDYNSYYHEMFLRGMPHLCEKMRRLTNKDTAARKKTEEEPAPDFYALSRLHPLPDVAPVHQAEQHSQSRQASNQGLLDLETALLERRRADILDRVNLLASAGALRSDPLAALSIGQGGLPNNPGLLRPGMMFDGLGGGAAPAPCPTPLQQLFATRQQNPDMAQLLAMNSSSLGGGMGICGLPNSSGFGF